MMSRVSWNAFPFFGRLQATEEPRKQSYFSHVLSTRGSQPTMPCVSILGKTTEEYQKFSVPLTLPHLPRIISDGLEGIVWFFLRQQFILQHLCKFE